MSNELMRTQYTLEIEDHLFEIYNDFQRRNTLEEWQYFLQRPELAQEKKCEEISLQLLSYHLDCGNIKTEIVRFLEDFFHYMDHVERYAEAFSYSAMEFYHQVLLSKTEFPPIDEFGELSADVDYDGYIDKFQEIYFGQPPEDAESYAAAMKDLAEFGIVHPYTALMESEYSVLCQDAENALAALKKMDDCYYKYLTLGMLLIDLEFYADAEEALRYAYELHTGKIDHAIIEGMFIALFCQGKHQEALDFAADMEDLGFAHVLESYKKDVLSSFYELAGEKAKHEPLDDEEISLIFDYLKLEKEYDKIIALGEHRQKDHALEERDWLTLIEAYLLTCNDELAEQNMQALSVKEPAPSIKTLTQLNVIKAQLRFLNRQTAEAYALMDDLYLRNMLNPKQLQTYAQMCFTTGRYHTAEKSYSSLRFDAPDNPEYLTALAKIFIEQNNPERAYDFCKHELEKLPENEDLHYYLVQSAINDGDPLNAKRAMRRAKEFLSPERIGFLRAQIEELLYSINDAKETYTSLINNLDLETVDHTVAEEIYYRYFFLITEEEEERVDVLFAKMDEAIKKLSSRSKLYELYGDIQNTTMEDTAAAKKYYDLALEENPYNNDALHSVMDLCIETHRDEEAWQYASKYVLNTDTADAYLLHAHISLDAGHFDAFAKDVEAYLQRGGSKSETYDLAATHAMKTGDYEKALECFELLLQNPLPDEAPCYDEMATCHCKLGRYNGAIDLLQQVLVQDDYAEFYPLLIEIQQYIGDFSGAKKSLENYRKAAGLSKNDDDYLFHLVQQHLASGKLKTAIAVSQATEDNETGHLCGRACLLNGNLKLALGVFYVLIDRDPSNIDNYAWMALSAALKGDMDEAWHYAVLGRTKFKSTHGEPEEVHRPDLLCQYGFLQTLCGKTEKALAAFEKAMNLPTCAEEICTQCHEAHYGMALLHAFSGDKAQAKASFDKALAGSPYNIIYQTMKKKLTK